MCSEFPAASGSSRPCVVSCGASRVIIFPPPVLITFPGPILSTCPQETVLGSSGTVPGSSGMPEGTAGISLRSHGAEIPRNAEFVPKFTSRPILGLDPQEAVLGFSGMVSGSLGMMDGAPGASRRSLRSYGAQFPRSGGFTPKSGPRRASRCSYIFNSRWIHPCRRSSCGSQQPAGNGSEERIPDPEKPGTENEDAAKEEKEELEV
ncbi:PREDICTED: uncharacterized protein LOC101819976 [Ficedula albicollis]|uniref:uncharacterized protein LOC101819976 n=1 Tax=Ficedula albicollis TaxID=59894 RepID=UPI000359F25E|nr:PREDICTED: uncharacterized protein LOC101819976 [Ficedula albicollis]